MDGQFWPGSFTLRPASTEDQAFLFRLYASTRAEELATLGWDTAQRERFLRQQLGARDRSYALQFPAADDRVILRDGVAVGRLILDRAGEAILLVDLALVPEQRGHGLGTALLRHLQSEATAAGRPLRLHVDWSSHARHLYERLGFAPRRKQGFYLEMEWLPPAAPGRALASGAGGR